ncbi:MAG: nucleoside-diphosphate kinase [Patescibacteria group bacterium]
MPIQKTFFIIKPEAFEIRNDIKGYIAAHSDLKLVESRIIRLTEADIDALYGDDLASPLLEAAKRHSAGKQVEVCILEGESAVERFLDLAGRHFDGELCEPHTIRYVFGRLGTVKYGDVVYFLNAVHKASPGEVRASLEWFYHQ